MGGKNTFAFHNCVYVLIGWLIMDGGIAGFSLFLALKEKFVSVKCKDSAILVKKIASVSLITVLHQCGAVVLVL